DPIRDRFEVWLQSRFESLRKEFTDHVNAKIIPILVNELEEKIMTTEDKQILDAALGDLRNFSETYKATRVRVADLEKQLADANAQLAAAEAENAKDKADLADHKGRLTAAVEALKG